jgi:capsular polysaccharide biosynthesis protein
VEIHHYLAILRRRIAIILVAVLAAVAAAWLATPRTPHYTAKAVIYVGARQFSLAPTAQYLYDPTQLVQRLMLTYAQMLDSEPIADDALRATGVQRSAADVVANSAVVPGKDTQLLSVSVTDTSPDVARTLTNGIAQAFVEKVQTLEPNVPAREGSLPALPAYIFEKAKVPTVPDSSGLYRNIILAGFFALMVSVGIVFLLEYLDLTMKNPAEAEARLQLPVLGVIPYSPDQAARGQGGAPAPGTTATPSPSPVL